jgi:hypothetical protein
MKIYLIRHSNAVDLGTSDYEEINEKYTVDELLQEGVNHPWTD